MQVSLGKTIQDTWYAFTDLTVENIARHEVGHILGHSHNNNPDSIMYPTIVTQFKTDDFRPSTPTPTPTPTQTTTKTKTHTPKHKPSQPVKKIIKKLENY